MVDMNEFERQLARDALRDVGPVRHIDDGAIFAAVTSATRSPRWRFSSMFGALKFVVAGAVVAVLGTSLLVAGPLDRRGATMSGATGIGTLPPASGPATNGLIAFDRGGDIFVGDLATGEATAIVDGPEEDAGPIFSPDGTKIAFVRFDSQDGASIVVVKADGSAEWVVAPAGFSRRGLGPIGWTPDGTGLVVNNDGDGSRTPYFDGRLTLYDASGVAAARDLTPPLPAHPGAPWFSPAAGVAPMFQPPAGGLILSGNYDALDVFDADLQELGQLGTASLEDFQPYWVSGPAWSPDATMIAFGLDRAVGHSATVAGIGAFVMAADGTDLRQISDERAGTLAWSPDGTRIALERLLEPKDPGPDAVLVIVDVPTGAEHVLLATAVTQKREGTSIAGADDLFRSVATPDFRQWDFEGWGWSPDGRSLLVLERGGTRPWLVDVDSGEAAELPWEADSLPSWQRVGGG